MVKEATEVKYLSPCKNIGVREVNQFLALVITLTFGLFCEFFYTFISDVDETSFSSTMAVQEIPL